jgi:hypothetical protein
MLSPTCFLIAANKLDIPFNLEIYFGQYSRVFNGCIVAIQLENKGGGIKELSNYLTLSFKIAFSFSISSIEYFKASPVASWNSMILEGGTH